MIVCHYVKCSAAPDTIYIFHVVMIKSTMPNHVFHYIILFRNTIFKTHLSINPKETSVLTYKVVTFWILSFKMIAFLISIEVILLIGAVVTACGVLIGVARENAILPINSRTEKQKRLYFLIITIALVV